MIKFGNIIASSNVFLAPMAGITNVAYREFCHPFGIGVTYSEMISDCGLIYQNKETYKYLEISEIEHPVVIQLFGGTKDTLLQAIDIIQEERIPCDFIDINLGCPVPKVTRTGAGSAWLKRIDELGIMMKAVVKKSKIPVTAKIRIGWDEKSINVEETVRMLQDAGVSLIAVHPRTKSQLYLGHAQYDVIKDLKKIMSVPLVISGDIFSLEEAISALETTKADGVMVARGALGNPFLITQIDHYLKTGEKLPDADLKTQLSYLRNYAGKLAALKGEEIAIRELKGIAPHFLKGYPNMKPFKVDMTTKMTKLSDLLKIIDNISKQSL